MSIIVACQCGKRFRAKDEHAGKRTKCPGCDAVLKIPSPEPSEAAPPKPKAKSSKPVDSPTKEPESVERRKTSHISAYQRPRPTRSFSIAGLIVSALLVIMGIKAIFDAPPRASSVQREVRVSQVLGPVMGGAALAVRSFLPNLTLLRGFAAVCGGMGLSIFLMMVGMHGVGRPGTMVGMLVIPAVGFAVGFRTREVPSSTVTPVFPARAPSTTKMPPKVGNLAVWSVVFGVLSFCLIVPAVPAVICGHIALARIKRSGSTSGRWIAVVGVVLGYLSVLLMVLSALIVLVVG